MPIYEYRCESCQAEFEELVRTAADEREVTCARCGGRNVSRRPSVVAMPRAAAAPVSLPRRACGRCGDPDGPCALS